MLGHMWKHPAVAIVSVCINVVFLFFYIQNSGSWNCGQFQPQVMQVSLGHHETLTGRPKFPDRSRCKSEMPPTQKSFTYSQPNVAYRSSPLYQEVKNKLVTLRTNRFLPEKLRSGLSFADFKRELFSFKDKYDGNLEVEGYESAKGQKRNTVQWFWGHHIWFGAGDDKFEVTDHMDDKWLEDIAAWVVGYGLPMDTFSGAKILDIGSWTGSTTYALASLGASHIVSVEEAVKYSLFTQYVSDSYQLPVQTISRSLYELEVQEMQEAFDIVYFPGVLYHLSDPMMALRILYNRLKVGGIIIVETMIPMPFAELAYDRITGTGNNYFTCGPKVLGEWLEDVGFTSIVVGQLRRTEAIARKEKRESMKQAGLARRDIC
eukprot:s88_g48.t1